MRYAAAAAVVVAMMFGVTAMAQAPKAPAGTTTITGKLTKVDVEGKALTIAVTVEKETKDTVVTCNDATRIFQMAPPVRNDAGNLVPAPAVAVLRPSSRTSRSGSRWGAITLTPPKLPG